MNHSNRKPIGKYLIVFLDEIANHQDEKTKLWKVKSTDFIGIANNMREEEARKATSGIILDIGSMAFDSKEYGDDIPKIGDRVTFTSYSGMHKIEGDFFYRSLKDAEIHDYYIPQRNLI